MRKFFEVVLLDDEKTICARFTRSGWSRAQDVGHADLSQPPHSESLPDALAHVLSHAVVVLRAIRDFEELRAANLEEVDRELADPDVNDLRRRALENRRMEIEALVMPEPCTPREEVSQPSPSPA